LSADAGVAVGFAGSGMDAKLLATSAATCGCEARMGEGAVIGALRGSVWRLGTENRSCTECGRTGVGRSDWADGIPVAVEAGRGWLADAEGWLGGAAGVGLAGGDGIDAGGCAGF